ncbi:hypothetical protein ACM2M2_005589, partial [Klebsiella pneumoniae]
PLTNKLIKEENNYGGRNESTDRKRTDCIILNEFTEDGYESYSAGNGVYWRQRSQLPAAHQIF